MDDLAQQRIRRVSGPVMASLGPQVQQMFDTAQRATSSDALETLLTVELAKLGMPVAADYGDTMFIMGFVIGRIHRAGATREQILAFLSNVVDESSKIEEEILLPGMTMPVQLRMSRMLSAQIWELFYAIEDAAPIGNEPDAENAADERWSAAIRAATFIVELQMIVLRSV